MIKKKEVDFLLPFCFEITVSLRGIILARKTSPRIFYRRLSLANFYKNHYLLPPALFHASLIVSSENAILGLLKELKIILTLKKFSFFLG